ncbi:MAG: hypothetical protein U5L01_17255 [Rheinheimera sp.]|nr:hypothetical protein [Rheinheimera sp.]
MTHASMDAAAQKAAGPWSNFNSVVGWY